MTEGQKLEHRHQTSTGQDCELGLLDPTDKERKNEGDTKDETAEFLNKHQGASATATSKVTTSQAAPVVVGGVVNRNVISPSRDWNVSTVRGKMSDRCLWSVCKAMTLGVFLIATGAGMATLGYYSDSLSTVPERRGNETVMVKNEKRDSQLNILTYLGPVVMGVGGFIIVAACVMTFEARDTAPKIVPVWFRKNRPQVVPSSSACSNGSVNSSRTSWERFLVRRNLAANRNQIKSQSSEKRQNNQQKEFRNSVNDSLINFGKFLQSSMDAGKLSPVAPRIRNRTTAKTLRKCPSESDILRAVALNKRSPSDRGTGEGDVEDNPEAEKLLKPEQRVDQVFSKNLLAPPSFYRGGSPTPHRPSIGGQKYFRQAVSVDYQGDCGGHTLSPNSSALENGLVPHAGNVNLMVDGQTKYDSNNSMAMDLYLPQGSFTLKVKEEKRNQGGNSPGGGGGDRGNHQNLGVRSTSNASSASGAKSTPPGSRRHTPQSSFDRTLKSLSRDSSRSSGGGYRTPQQSISRNNSGARSPLTHTPPSLSRNNSGATAEVIFRTPQAVSRNNSGTRSPHSKTPPNLSRNNSGANNAQAELTYRRNTCIPNSPNWLQDKSFSRFESHSQDENETTPGRGRTDSLGSDSSRNRKHGNSDKITTDNSSGNDSDPKDQDEQSSVSKRHRFVRQRALENKPEAE